MYFLGWTIYKILQLNSVTASARDRTKYFKFYGPINNTSEMYQHQGCLKHAAPSPYNFTLD